jgi:uncharacterized protein (TIGR03067 family)
MKMHTRIALVAGLLFVGVGLLSAADSAEEEAIKKDRREMQGTWKVASYELDGNQPIPEEQLRNVKATLDANGKITVEVDGSAVLEATTKIDPTKKPKTIDITFTDGELKGQTGLGIYELKDDTFRYCRAAPGKDRPIEFSSKAGSGHTLILYKREKSK